MHGFPFVFDMFGLLASFGWVWPLCLGWFALCVCVHAYAGNAGIFLGCTCCWYDLIRSKLSSVQVGRLAAHVCTLTFFCRHLAVPVCARWQIGHERRAHCPTRSSLSAERACLRYCTSIRPELLARAAKTSCYQLIGQNFHARAMIVLSPGYLCHLGLSGASRGFALEELQAVKPDKRY